MPRSTPELRRDARLIWNAGLEAVRSERLVRGALGVEGDVLAAGPERLELRGLDRIVVVGAGKAGAGMAAAVEEVLGPRLLDQKRVTGWVNVPEDCVRPLGRIHLHGARPPGVNEPTAAGVAGTNQILALVESLGPRDLCLCLISGGGSALLPAPAEGVGLEDKLAVTRHLSAAGATIQQLNTVRKQLSRVKGGGLARACRASRLVSLVISDVLGDPLDAIASGPTVPDPSTPQDALAVLERFDSPMAGVPARVFEYLHAKAAKARDIVPNVRSLPSVVNLVIGNNATAVEAAGWEARRLGYAPILESAPHCEGLAEDVGRRLARLGCRMRAEPGPNCLVSGGEPVVQLVPAAQRGQGGRNQQLVLAALVELGSAGGEDVVILSAGTDGEDGPTDAAGAVGDEALRAAAAAAGLDPAAFLARNDAYHFFRPLGGLVETGPTHTNVCDLRVVLVGRAE
jgi:hydroxypyruvate reductase